MALQQGCSSLMGYWVGGQVRGRANHSERHWKESSKEGVGSPLDHMTEEEKEAEAEKLHELLEKLDQ